MKKTIKIKPKSSRYRRRTRVYGYNKRCAISPPILFRPVKAEELSEQEERELKRVLFPKREIKIQTKKIHPSELITSEQKAILDQYEIAKSIGDEEALKYLEPKVKAIKSMR